MVEENLENENLENENSENYKNDNLQDTNVDAKRTIQDYESIENRLKEIESKISNEDLDMDQTLKLYEEAVDLGMKASQTVENNVLVDNNSSNTEEDNSDTETIEDDQQ